MLNRAIRVPNGVDQPHVQPDHAEFGISPRVRSSASVSAFNTHHALARHHDNPDLQVQIR